MTVMKYANLLSLSTCVLLTGNDQIRTLGGVVRRSGGGGTAIQNAAQIDEEDEHSYQGYAIVSGRFRTTDTQGELDQSCVCSASIIS